MSLSINRRQRRPSRHRYGFTLLEAMMAAAILLVAVFGVMAAITSGQQHAY
ncbi:MAG: prepilin-type N-terminal cleavage/methylation domain-containing protein, partial [Planctomycetota bacterium]